MDSRRTGKSRLVLASFSFLVGATLSVTAGEKVDVRVASSREVMAMFEKVALPQYPYEARRSRIEGSGLFRMFIAEDGKVTSVGVMKSTGSKFLDLAAAGGLYQWRAKPGRRREVDMPVAFVMRP